MEKKKRQGHQKKLKGGETTPENSGAWVEHELATVEKIPLHASLATATSANSVAAKATHRTYHDLLLQTVYVDPN